MDEPSSKPQESRPQDFDQAYRALLIAVWKRNERTILERARSLRATTKELRDGAADVRIAELAEHDAHRLSGCLGSFGLEEASRMAQEIERILRSPRWTDSQSRKQMADLSICLEENIIQNRLG
jgi:HPt (histidine-containing phosphotransfer) domain-containing protein